MSWNSHFNDVLEKVYRKKHCIDSASTSPKVEQLYAPLDYKLA